ncbi:MAG: hypothetical protein GEU99_00605 [Luteitalea sp.]|nr:hypothetical protein [Luteitalea sp.]
MNRFSDEAESRPTSTPITESPHHPVTLSPGHLVTLPWWARALDLLAALLFVVLCSATLHNGFRLTIGETRISATSLWRIVVLLVVVVGIRHALVRRPSWPADAWQRSRRFWRDPATRAAWPTWLSTRLTVLVAAYFATLIIGFPGADAPVRVNNDEWLNLPARWDAMWYLRIAKEGFEYDPAITGQQNVAFFPAYPMLMRVGGALLGAAGRPASDESYGALSERSELSWLWAGVVISLWSFLLAQRYLFRLGRELVGDDQAASRALLLTATFPFALFFSAVYTEALFLLASLGAFYHYRRREWVQAALWGALVGLVRPNGCFLSVPLALMGLGLATHTDDGRRRWDLRTLVIAGLVAALPGLTMLAHTAWLYGLTGQWFAWAEAQQAWGREYMGLQESTVQFFEVLQSRELDDLARGQPYRFLNAVAVLGALGLSWPIARRFGLPYAAVIWLNLGPPLLAGGFMSTGRIVATLFPVFLYLGWRLSPAVCQHWVTVGLLLQGAFAAIHFTWRPLV